MRRKSNAALSSTRRGEHVLFCRGKADSIKNKKKIRHPKYNIVIALQQVLAL